MAADAALPPGCEGRGSPLRLPNEDIEEAATRFVAVALIGRRRSEHSTGGRMGRHLHVAEATAHSREPIPCQPLVFSSKLTSSHPSPLIFFRRLGHDGD